MSRSTSVFAKLMVKCFRLSAVGTPIIYLIKLCYDNCGSDPYCLAIVLLGAWVNMTDCPLFLSEVLKKCGKNRKGKSMTFESIKHE